MSLINKIDIYYSDITKFDKSISFGRLSAKIRAVSSFVVWGTSFSEYFGYRFWEKSFSEKREYMTRRHMFKFFDKYNQKDFRSRIGDKSLSSKYYGEFMKREQFFYNEGLDKFREFCKKHSDIFIKKSICWGGDFCRLEHLENDDEIKKCYDTLSDDYIVEPKLENCEEIKKYSPISLNTIKVTVLNLKKGPEIQFAIIRFGNNTVVDNVHNGGICCGIDIASGKINTLGFDKNFRRFSKHPVSGYDFLDFEIPQFDKVREIALKASKITPELRYASWDIAVTPDGPVLIEGNWDAEFYAEQSLYNCGTRKRFVEKLEVE